MKVWLFLFGLLLVAGLQRAFAKTTFLRPLTDNDRVVSDCPLIDDSGIVINPSSCDIADGSILNITGTGSGPLLFKWYDANNKLIASGANLTNVSPGYYTLQLHDQSKCGSIVSKTYEVGQKTDVTINQNNLKTTPAGCAGNDGALTGLAIQNAAKIQWLNISTGATYSTADLTGVPSGAYRLTVTGMHGCTDIETFTIGSTVHFPKIIEVDTTKGLCNQIAGTLKVTFNMQPDDPSYTFKLLDVSDAVSATGGLSYDPAGPVSINIPITKADSPYRLILTDPHYCQLQVASFTLSQPALTIKKGPGFLVRNDACGRHTGAIIGVETINGTPVDIRNPNASQVWLWSDSTGTVIARTLFYLVGLGKGTYTLTVQDVTGCDATAQFTVSDSTAEAIQPMLKENPTLCLPGSTVLTVTNLVKGYKYRLYDGTQTNLLSENVYGSFQVNVTQTTKYYITSVTGFCESPQTPATVTVIAPGVVIPNTFTPNNDGVNDYWDIPHIGDFPGAEVSVYTRDGFLVYHSINYSHPFDGKYKGKLLPAGVYYYVVDLKSPECFGKVSGFLTLLR